MIGAWVTVNDRMQHDYRYRLSAPTGRDFDPAFAPGLTPPEMLRLGIFGGKYMRDCRGEFPASWFAGAKLAASDPDPALNYFGIMASQSLAEVLPLIIKSLVFTPRQASE